MRAVRTWNRPRTKATITVFNDEHEVIAEAGGKRAERAQAVVMAAYGEKPLHLYGLRGDAHAAQVEATRLVTATTMRVGGRRGWGPGAVIPITTAREAVAILVEEDTPGS